jgi:hypothetical protein
MKTLEANSIRTGKTDGEMAGMDDLSKFRRSPMSVEPGSLRDRYYSR